MTPDPNEGLTGSGIRTGRGFGRASADDSRIGPAITTETPVTKLANIQPPSVMMEVQIEPLRT
ncbi:MAG: hypothetical protein ACUVQI_00505 [Thermochromatium sp.]